ncbi:hypothetical protein ABT369_54145 [Dactylosporangium sp. NPDC000244]|uniref:hypothetical protein n=1 Tax=Dactylosporangium sp. NPDC000244 TaxID=3154365 RepID=UPI0033343813
MTHFGSDQQGVENLDDLSNRSCPSYYRQQRRVYTKHLKSDTHHDSGGTLPLRARLGVVASHVEDVSQEEMGRRPAAMFQQTEGEESPMKYVLMFVNAQEFTADLAAMDEPQSNRCGLICQNGRANRQKTTFEVVARDS